MSSVLSSFMHDDIQSYFKEDLTAIVAMFDVLRFEIDRSSHVEFPSISETVDRLGRRQRVALYRPHEISHNAGFAGFFGKRRSDVSVSTVTEVCHTDAMMLVELESVLGVAAYCSFELDDGNWGNLVVITDESAVQVLRSNPVHSYAVGRLSPDFYESIRLHRGRLNGGAPSIVSTKLYELNGREHPKASSVDWTVTARVGTQ